MDLLTPGGKTTDEKIRILKIHSQSFHEKTTVFMGSEEDVKMIEDFMAREETAGI
jgi:fructose-1,6-bisphosphatase